jgi:predicted ArsR family transcriptional regulator
LASVQPVSAEQGRLADPPEPVEERIGRLVTALGDPTRRAVYFAVRRGPVGVTKDDVAAEVEIGRRLAGFHLDKLLEYGLITASSPKRPGRRGRPAKLYALNQDDDLSVSLPERHYDLLAELLLEATSDDSAATSAEALDRVGYAFGQRLGAAEVAAGAQDPPATAAEAVRRAAEALSRIGFAAKVDEDGGVQSITACSCPFERVAFADPERICGLDRAIWRGVLEAMEPDVGVAGATTRARGDEECRAELSLPR